MEPMSAGKKQRQPAIETLKTANKADSLKLLEEAQLQHGLRSGSASQPRSAVCGLGSKHIFGRTHKRHHSDEVIDALAPGESRTFWVINTDDDAVVFHVPDMLEYYRFPDTKHIQTQRLSQDSGDYWILRRDGNPVEHCE